MTKLKFMNRLKTMFTKNKKYIAVACSAALVGSLVSVQISSFFYEKRMRTALELLEELDYYSAVSDMTLEEYVDYEKERFQKEYGTEDKFQTIYEDTQVKEEVNGVTGAFRYTNKETGEVTEWNYFEELDEELAISKMTLEEYITHAKERFQKEYGTEDKFQTIHEDTQMKEEVNGATGAFRYTNKETGKVTEWNYFEELDEKLAISKMTQEEYIAYVKERFQKEYGTEDKFQTIYEDTQMKEEINGATGIFRYTDKETGEVTEWNYFEELDKLISKESSLNGGEKEDRIEV